MKKSFTFIVGIILLILIFLLVNTKPKIKTFSKVSFDEVSSAPFREKIVVKSSKKISASALPEPEKVPQWCEAYWDRLLSFGIKDYLHEIEISQNHDFTCFNFVLPKTRLESQMSTSCALGADGKIKNSNLCGSFLMIYRAVLVDRSTNERQDYSNMSLQLLLNKILGKIMQGEDIWKSEKENIFKMAAAIKELEPNNPSSYKVSGLLEALFENYAEVLKQSQEGLLLDPQNAELRDLWFYSKIKSDGFDPKMFDAYKGDDHAMYFLSAYYWRSGQLDQSRKILKALCDQYKDIEKYKNTYEQAMSTNDKEQAIFELKIPLYQETW